MTHRRIQSFLNDSAGAVTVDWTLLTGAIVGMALTSAASISGFVMTFSDDINTSLSRTETQDAAWDDWPNKGITNGACQGPAALEASYNALVDAGEDFTAHVRDGASGPMEGTMLGTWMNDAQTSDGPIFTDEFVNYSTAMQSGDHLSTPETTAFMTQFFACTLEAQPTDWSTVQGGSLAGNLLLDFGYQLPAG